MLREIISAGVCLSIFLAGATGGAQSAGDEAVNYLTKYIRVNTTNPPGNERLGAEFLADILKANGIEASLFDTQPGRSCVYARLKGNGKKRPIVLLNHIDVVPAVAEDWDHPPFAGEIHNNEIWGRGVIDMKGMAIAELETMLMLKRSGKQLERDVIFLGTPDEEAGGDHGAEWFAKNKPELVKDAEFLLNEGFHIESDANGTPKYWGVDVGEKSVLWLKLTATGDAGHGSMPMKDSAPNKLVKGLAQIVNSPPAPTVLPAVREYFENIASTESEPTRSYYKNIMTSVQEPQSYAQLLSNKLRSSMLRNTVSLTVLNAGYKTNVIPAEASAELDCRILPGVDKDKFVAEISEKIGDPSIKVTVIDWVKADPSPYKSELFDAIKEVARRDTPNIPVVPVVVPWFTDSHWFRDFGTIAYGFEPFKVDVVHLATMHGKNERLPVQSFKDGVRLLYEIVEKVAVASPKSSH